MEAYSLKLHLKSLADDRHDDEKTDHAKDPEVGQVDGIVPTVEALKHLAQIQIDDLVEGQKTPIDAVGEEGEENQHPQSVLSLLKNCLYSLLKRLKDILLQEIKGRRFIMLVFLADIEWFFDDEYEVEECKSAGTGAENEGADEIEEAEGERGEQGGHQHA